MTCGALGHDALMRVLDADADTDAVEVESGAMVCVHTGFSDTTLAM